MREPGTKHLAHFDLFLPGRLGSRGAIDRVRYALWHLDTTRTPGLGSDPHRSVVAMSAF
jgi:hypothetical protein